jgi:hypothetical protein
MEYNLDTKMWHVWCRKKYEKLDAKKGKKKEEETEISHRSRHNTDVI